MKLNINYCLLALLVIVLLYCCLGTNLLEGLDNTTFVDTAQKVQKMGKKHADQEYIAYQQKLQDKDLQ